MREVGLVWIRPQMEIDWAIMRETWLMGLGGALQDW